jgi:hypothetical protein
MIQAQKCHDVHSGVGKSLRHSGQSAGLIFKRNRELFDLGRCNASLYLSVVSDYTMHCASRGTQRQATFRACGTAKTGS